MRSAAGPRHNGTGGERGGTVGCPCGQNAQPVDGRGRCLLGRLREGGVSVWGEVQGQGLGEVKR